MGVGADASSCCRYCYSLSGCNAWAFFVTNGDDLHPGVVTLCNVAVNATTQGGMSAACPAGLGSYTLGTDPAASGFGGPGPCAAPASP